MSRALHVAKRVRTETAVGQGQVSVSSVAVDLARQIFGDLSGRIALLLGAGEMAEAAAKLLVKAGAKLLVVNRSPERAAELAIEFGGQLAALVRARPRRWCRPTWWSPSTAAKGFVVTRADGRAGHEGAPRAQPLLHRHRRSARRRAAVNELDNVYVYDIDNLSNVVAESMRGRQPEAGRAEALVNHEAASVRELGRDAQRDRHHCRPSRQGARLAVGRARKNLSGRLKHLSDADRKRSRP